MKLRADITTFAQFEQESLYEAWERFKDLLQRCPHHELPLGLVVQTFYYGLLTPNRTMIDAAACGNLLRKTAEEGYELLEKMAASSYHPQSERNNQRRSVGVPQVTDLSSITAELDVLNRKLDSLNMGGTAMRLQEIFCDKCRGEHVAKDCQDDNPFYVQEGAPVNQMMSKFISSTETRLQNQDASIKGLENQIGKLAKMIASKEPGTLPSNTETNPKEQVKAIELKSEKISESRGTEKNQVLDEQTESSKVFKKLHINIPFADALMQMPSYAKFLKDILANKRKLEDHMTVNLTENCSALKTRIRRTYANKDVLATSKHVC
ncbi:uncharacterized protein LOC142550049 [Primulina tabacum]|uniref:uncharacterized protein LOC142550049 n=1 Tax=Primulina tabacum TaxID=48773 RepID=UPI003F5A1AF2